MPLKDRRKALDKIARLTRNASAIEAIQIAQWVVRMALDEVAAVPGDVTDLHRGRTTVPVFRDAGARERARGMLLWLPTSPKFAGVLDPEEVAVWNARLSGETEEEIGKRLGKSQGRVSQMFSCAKRKLQDRHRYLADSNDLPIEILAWQQETAGDDSRRNPPNLLANVAVLSQRDRALRQGRLEQAGTGCKELDRLQLRAA